MRRMINQVPRRWLFEFLEHGTFRKYSVDFQNRWGIIFKQVSSQAFNMFRVVDA